MQIGVLGPLRVGTGSAELGPRDFRGAKPKQILQVLALRRGRTVPKSLLADTLWSESVPANHVATLETYVSLLRQTLDPGGRPRESVVVTERGGYRLDLERVELDLDAFDAALAEAAAAGPGTAVLALRRALGLARGDLLEDEPYADWAEPTRETYRNRRVQALIDLGRLCLLTGDATGALAAAEQAVALRPLAEPAYQVLMAAAYSLWRQDEALAAFDRCRRLLAEELGIDPLDETVAMQLAILRHEDIAPLLQPAPRPVAALVPDQRDEVRGLAAPGAAPQGGAPPVPDPPAPDPPGAGPPGALSPDTVSLDAAPLGAPGSRLPLMGRDAELAQLRAALDRACRGQFTLALLTGGSGLGKTRLLEALSEGCDLPVGSNRCSDLERTFPYLALALALRPVLPDAAPHGLPVLDALLERAERAQPLDDLTRLKAMETVADALSGRPPFVLLLDDAQWADPETVTTLAYLQRRLPEAPVLVVLACDRPSTVSGVLRGVRPTVRVDLHELQREDVDALGAAGLYEAAGGNPAYVASWLEARRQGSPEPFTRELRERLVAGAWDLGPQAYRLLCAAAAVPQEGFSVPLLARLVNAPETDVAEELDRLYENELLVVRGPLLALRSPALRTVLLSALSPARRALIEEAAREFAGDGQRRRSGDPAPADHPRRATDRDPAPADQPSPGR